MHRSSHGLNTDFFLFGGTRHFGYYDHNTWWPFPISRALRAMENHMSNSLALPKGSLALDAGCGVGHVALYMAQRGLRVSAIDIVEHHVEKAKMNIRAKGLEDRISVGRGDYHHLGQFPAENFDGVYTMETFVHATDPNKALSEFYRVLKPGGTITMYEYDHGDFSKSSNKASSKKTMDQLNHYAAMPAFASFEQGMITDLLEQAGFKDVKLEDLSRHVEPLLWVFFVLAYIPFIVIKLLGLEAYFINTVYAVERYRCRDVCRYVAVTGRKHGV